MLIQRSVPDRYILEGQPATERAAGTAAELTAQLGVDRIQLREGDVVDGLEQAPAALARLPRGGNVGTAVVRVGRRGRRLAT